MRVFGTIHMRITLRTRAAPGPRGGAAAAALAIAFLAMPLSEWVAVAAEKAPPAAWEAKLATLRKQLGKPDPQSTTTQQHEQAMRAIERLLLEDEQASALLAKMLQGLRPGEAPKAGLTALCDQVRRATSERLDQLQRGDGFDAWRVQLGDLRKALGLQGGTRDIQASYESVLGQIESLQSQSAEAERILARVARELQGKDPGKAPLVGRSKQVRDLVAARKDEVENARIQVLDQVMTLLGAKPIDYGSSAQKIADVTHEIGDLKKRRRNEQKKRLNEWLAELDANYGVATLLWKYGGLEHEPDDALMAAGEVMARRLEQEDKLLDKLLRQVAPSPYTAQQGAALSVPDKWRQAQKYTADRLDDLAAWRTRANNWSLGCLGATLVAIVGACLTYAFWRECARERRPELEIERDLLTARARYRDERRDHDATKRERADLRRKLRQKDGVEDELVRLRGRLAAQSQWHEQTQRYLEQLARAVERCVNAADVSPLRKLARSARAHEEGALDASKMAIVTGSLVSFGVAYDKQRHDLERLRGERATYRQQALDRRERVDELSKELAGVKRDHEAEVKNIRATAAQHLWDLRARYRARQRADEAAMRETLTETQRAHRDEVQRLKSEQARRERGVWPVSVLAPAFDGLRDGILGDLAAEPPLREASALFGALHRTSTQDDDGRLGQDAFDLSRAFYAWRHSSHGGAAAPPEPVAEWLTGILRKIQMRAVVVRVREPLSPKLHTSLRDKRGTMVADVHSFCLLRKDGTAFKKAIVEAGSP